MQDIASHFSPLHWLIKPKDWGVFAEQQQVLSEVLEVPSLMETCLRNGSYDDALDLRAFVSKTALMHPDLKVGATSVLLPSSLPKENRFVWTK